MKRIISASGIAIFYLLTAVVNGIAAPSASPAAATTQIVTPAVAAEYVHPHELVDIGKGRKMNLFCMGNGSHTVIFDSGLSDWSIIWALVQPDVAAHARACTYDRAGMGYSDSSDEPRSPIAIVEDLQKLIHAAKIATPVVLVGHSIGGFNMKLYAVLYPKDVAGLVLVDPLEERAYARTHDMFRSKYGTATAARFALLDMTGLSRDIAQYKDCATAARIHDLNPASDLYKNCTDPAWPPMGPIIAAERQKIQVKRTYQETQAAELADSAVGNKRSDDVYATLFSGRALGNKSLVVLTHSIYDPKDPMEAADYFGWNAMHEQTAALSTKGVNRIVPGTHHNIEIDRPQAIVSAVNDVLNEIAPK